MTRFFTDQFSVFKYEEPTRVEQLKYNLRVLEEKMENIESWIEELNKTPEEEKVKLKFFENLKYSTEKKIEEAKKELENELKK